MEHYQTASGQCELAGGQLMEFESDEQVNAVYEYFAKELKVHPTWYLVGGRAGKHISAIGETQSNSCCILIFY